MNRYATWKQEGDLWIGTLYADAQPIATIEASSLSKGMAAADWWLGISRQTPQDRPGSPHAQPGDPA